MNFLARDRLRCAMISSALDLSITDIASSKLKKNGSDCKGSYKAIN